MPLKGSRLLEIGCATGELLALAHSRGALTMGVEISEYAAQVAKERYGLEVRVGDLEHLDIPAESFDIILALEVIEHVLSPRAFLKEIALFLAPGGLVVLSTPNYACGRQLKEEWLGFRTSFEHLYFFTPEVLVHMAGSEGLDLLYWATAGSGKAAPLQTRKKMKAWLQKIPGGVVLGQMVKLFKDLTAKDPWVKFGQGHRLLAFFKSRGQGNDLVFDNP
ncbi:MAG: class I SAM-dependent methyltransferase [Deltaproteobacteria bacterium]|nr:class I SAM-dependent methyltransferase [Deltaproteobacteria bacterium]